jgi:tetratricopeptide (TPR) repeat protein
MKIYLFLLSIASLAVPSFAQVPYNSAVPNGYTKRAMISEQVGLTQVTVRYHRPAVRGREGKVWGQLVPKGFVDQGFGNGNPAPWRAGSNETTVIEFDNDVKIEGQPLTKGKYGFFVAYDPAESTIIFSKRSDSWGSFFYDEKEDVLRVKVKPRPVDTNVEYLKYEFSEQTPNSATLALTWEKLTIPFKIEVDLLKQQYEAFVVELQNPRSYTPQSLSIAANWALQNNYQLENALDWANKASGTTFPGDPRSFTALSTKAGILEKLGRSAEATTVLTNALQYGNVGELQQLGRQLLAAKNTKTALEVFQFNYTKNPNNFGAIVGMARGLSANADYPKALEFATKALPLAPNEQNKQAVQAMIDKLKAGKDIN